MQACHQTSYQEIVDRRGTAEFQMPCGGVVNDYVAFYFSPLTAFTFTIDRGNVNLRDLDGSILGSATSDDRVFLVANVEQFRNAGSELHFSDFPLNSQASLPTLENDLNKLESHVHWDVFDDAPKVARIPEVGFDGVCKYFADRDTPARYQNRSSKRMAEFLVKDAVSLNLIDCIIAKNGNIGENLQRRMDASNWNIPVYAKPGCYF